MRFRFLFILFSILAGCASKTPQVDRFLSERPNVPLSHEVARVPFVQQEAGHCGPATLSMVMAWAGQPVPVETLVSQVYTPGMEGSLQTDMISASRRQGLMAIPLKGIPDLLQEVSAGHPVIVFENLALSWLPQWHYAVVFGYDLKQEKVLMHSGPEANKRWDLRKFERSWKLGDYWGLVVLPPSQLSATANELEHVKAAAALEQLGKLNEALTAYQAILNKWPQSLAALIGSGNVFFMQQKYQEAEKALLLAVQYHPQSPAARHNLEVAQQARKQKR